MNILVIGNGFDLAYVLPKKYKFQKLKYWVAGGILERYQNTKGK